MDQFQTRRFRAEPSDNARTDDAAQSCTAGGGLGPGFSLQRSQELALVRRKVRELKLRQAFERIGHHRLIPERKISLGSASNIRWNQSYRTVCRSVRPNRPKRQQ